MTAEPKDSFEETIVQDSAQAYDQWLRQTIFNMVVDYTDERSLEYVMEVSAKNVRLCNKFISKVRPVQRLENIEIIASIVRESLSLC